MNDMMMINRRYLVRLRSSDPKPAIRVEASSLDEARRIAFKLLTPALQSTATIEEESLDNRAQKD